MKGKKAYTITWILTYAIPIIILLMYFYITSNENIKFIVEAPRISFKELSKEYNFINDPNNIIEITVGEKVSYITFDYPNIIYNKSEIENGKLTIPLEKEIVLNNVYYKYDFQKNEFKRIVFSEEIKEAVTINKIFIALSMMIIIGAFSVGVLLIIKKMDVMKNYRRLAASVSMFVLFLIFLILSVITKYIFLVFGVLFLSTSLHYIEWIIHRKKNGLPIKEEIAQKVVISND